MANNNNQNLLTGNSSPDIADEKAQEIKNMQSASAAGKPIDEFLRRFVNLYLEDQDHPERTRRDLGALAREIRGEIGPTVPEATASDIQDQLEALKSGQESPSSDTSQGNVQRLAEPVMMFNGQFVHESEDIRINGPGIDFVFKRTYKNQVNYNGPLGFNWDHSYNLWLREANTTVFRSTGDLREEDYVRHRNFGQAGFNYFVPPDGQHGILRIHNTGPLLSPAAISISTSRFKNVLSCTAFSG